MNVEVEKARNLIRTTWHLLDSLLPHMSDQQALHLLEGLEVGCQYRLKARRRAIDTKAGVLDLKET